jgi:exopolysaccharide production protein ExoZ
MKIATIQLLRAIAAWMVVFHHYMQLGHENNYSTSMGVFFIEHGNFGVDIFFVVSGFVMYYMISLKEYSVRSFLIGRFFRIAPAYWVATLTLLIAALIYRDFFSWTNWSADSLVLSLLFIPNNNPSGIGTYPFLTVGWTLNIEIFFYLVLGLCLVLRKPWRFLICGAFLMLTPYVWQQDWVYGDILANRLLKEFVFGLFIGYAYLGWPRVRDWIQNYPAISLLFIVASIAILYMDLRGARAFGASGLLLAGLCLERVVARDQTWISRLFAHIGDVSYSTYLFHPIIIPIVFGYYGLPGHIAGELVLLCICIAFVYGASLLSYAFVERSTKINGMARRIAANSREVQR